MILRAAELAGVLLMVAAGGAALAGDPAFLGDWARGDGRTHRSEVRRSRVRRRGAEFRGSTKRALIAAGRKRRQRKAPDWGLRILSPCAPCECVVPVEEGSTRIDVDESGS